MVILLVVIPIVSSFFTILIGNYEYKALRERASDIRKVNYFGTLINDVRSCKENKVLSTERFLYAKYKELFQKFMIKDKQILKYKSVSAIVFKTLESSVGIVVISFVIYFLVIKTILIGTANTYINSIWGAIRSTDQLINNIANIYNKTLYVQNIFDFVDESENIPAVNIEDLYQVKTIESIEFIDVSFRYRDYLPYVLENISCKINKNEKIVIVGESGSGKSTFIKLMSSLYYDYEGEILVNGISLRRIDKNSLYKKIGIVFQDFTQYEFTLKDNLVYGNSKLNLSEEMSYNIFKRFIESGIMTFIKKLQFGMDTQLGSKFDGGVQLSGGEWQQVSFVRTIMRDSDLFIFDEPSSSLDVITEENMYNMIKREAGESICILVTHRLYTVNNYAERALVFKDKQIIEDDTIYNLLSYDSYYRYMMDKVSKNNF